MAFVFIVLLVAFSIPLWFLLKIILKHQHLRETIDKIPGPKASWLFGNVLQFKFERTEFTYQMIDFMCNYGAGGIFRMWVGPVPLIILTRAHTIEPLLSSNKLIEKSSNYNFLKNWIGTGLLVSGGEKWRYRRKMLTPTFHFSILATFLDVFNQQSKILVEQVQPFVDKNLPFNIYPYVSRCALDIICETAMGVHANAQQVHKSDYVQAVVQMCEILFKYERMPWLWFKPIFNLTYGKTYATCMKALRNFVDTVIRDRIEERNKVKKDGTIETRKRLAFLDLLLNMQNEHKLSYEDIREEVDTFMFEGHDTSSASISWTLYLLGQHPEVQTKVYEELQSIFGFDDRDPTEEDLKEMKYLECVVKESLRVYTSVPLFARRLTEDFETDGYKIPSGIDVMIVPFAIHRDMKMWGENTSLFVPERFLPEASAGRHPFAYVPFSAGSRNCIGQKFAMMEEKVMLSSLLRKFQVFSLDPPMSDKLAIPDLVLRPVNGIKVRLVQRTS